MFRNQYDTDVTVWSPEGRLLQVEYAMESVKQGSACVGLRNRDTVVLAALKRSVSELSRHQKKLYVIDDQHMAAGIAGLTADARSLIKYMQNASLEHKYVYGVPIPPHELMADVADKHQRTTQTYVRRPFGVGLLIAAVTDHDDSGSEGGKAHLYQTCPSGNLYEFYASAIGARSQAARTYLEKYSDSYAEATTEQLVVHALQALVGCVSGDDTLTVDNASVAVVTADRGVNVVEGTALQPYLDQLEVKQDDDDEDEEEEEGGEEGKEEEAEAMET